MKKYQELKQKVDEFGWVKFLPGDKGQKWSEHSLGHAQDLLDRFSEAVEVQQEKVLEMREIGKLLAAHCNRMEKEVQLFFDDQSRQRAVDLAKKDADQIEIPGID